MSRAHELIPGGCHTYSKGNKNYSPNAPATIVRGKGGLCWDAYGREFVDWGMGINNVLIGHVEPEIDEAAIAAIRNGQSFSRPSELEEQAAEAVLGLFPHADMVKFCKNGSDANNAAVRLARAVTGRQAIAFDGTAPFFSTADWFCHAQPRYSGTLDAERGFTLTYQYNDTASVQRVFATRPLACFILEVCRTEKPRADFLEAVTWLCRQHDTLLVIDEVVAGFRYGLSGAAPIFGLEPDLFTIGKGLGNGHSVCALLGKREYMRRGGDDVFLLSTTNGAEQHGLAAALAVTAFYQKHDVIGRLASVGRQLALIVEDEARPHGLTQIRIRTDFDCRPLLRMPDVWREPFHTTLIEHGVLWPYAWCCPCYRRAGEEMTRTRLAVRAACARIANERRAA